MDVQIGIFDSGHGGLEVLQYLASRHPTLRFSYIADLEFMPYGTKSLELITHRCEEIIQKLKDEGCEAIIIACNTATAVAIDCMREKFDLPIIGIEPYLNYINKAPQKNIKEGSVGALVTPITFKSERFKNLKELRDPHNLVKVETIAELAPLIEELIGHRNLEKVKATLRTLLADVGKHKWKEVILGCTHYPLIAEFIEEVLDAACISPTASVAAQLEKRLNLSTECMVENKSIDCSFRYLNTQDSKWLDKKMSDFLFWRYP